MDAKTRSDVADFTALVTGEGKEKTTHREIRVMTIDRLIILPNLASRRLAKIFEPLGNGLVANPQVGQTASRELVTCPQNRQKAVAFTGLAPQLEHNLPGVAGRSLPQFLQNFNILLNEVSSTPQNTL